MKMFGSGGGRVASQDSARILLVVYKGFDDRNALCSSYKAISTVKSRISRASRRRDAPMSLQLGKAQETALRF